MKSLATSKLTETDSGVKSTITGVRENRLSGLGIHVLIAISIFFMDAIGKIPMAVLFGLFLYMGFASLGGNQFADRLMLWITDPKLYPKTHYTRTVPHHFMHKFTLVQLLCFVVLWVLKGSRIGILFPLMIAALVPIYFLLGRFFPREHLDTLTAEEDGEEDAERHIFD